MMRCRVCGEGAAFKWRAALLGHDVGYHECPRCLYVQTDEPHWLEQAYQRSINVSDTGILVRNQDCLERTLLTLWLLKGLDQRVKDVAGGHGILVRMLRDAGVDAHWSDKYSENLLAPGFEDDGRPCFLATSFESFEHFVEPVKEFQELMASSQSLLISTLLAPQPMPAAADWWYYGLEHGQHIGFFRRATLEYIAASKGMRLLSDGGSFHLFTNAPLSEYVWRKVMKRRRLFLRWARSGLVSKTWLDHQLMAHSK